MPRHAAELHRLASSGRSSTHPRGACWLESRESTTTGSPSRPSSMYKAGTLASRLKSLRRVAHESPAREGRSRTTVKSGGLARIARSTADVVSRPRSHAHELILWNYVALSRRLHAREYADSAPRSDSRSRPTVPGEIGPRLLAMDRLPIRTGPRRWKLIVYVYDPITEYEYDHRRAIPGVESASVRPARLRRPALRRVVDEHCELDPGANVRPLLRAASDRPRGDRPLTTTPGRRCPIRGDELATPHGVDLVAGYDPLNARGGTIQTKGASSPSDSCPSAFARPCPRLCSSSRTSAGCCAKTVCP